MTCYTYTYYYTFIYIHVKKEFSDTTSVHLFKYSVEQPGEMRMQVDGGTFSNLPAYGTSDSSREFGSKYVTAT